MVVETQTRDLPKTQTVGELNDWAGRPTISLFYYTLNGKDPKVAKATEAEMQQRIDEIARLIKVYEQFPKSDEEAKVFTSFKAN